jgi:hypothetical protein
MKPDAAQSMATVRSTAGGTRCIREVSLCKGHRHYVFRYESGREEQIIKVFAEMAADPKEAFDWIDASVLAYQMGRRFVICSQRQRLRNRASPPTHASTCEWDRVQIGGMGF